MMKRPGHVPRDQWPEGHLANMRVPFGTPPFQKMLDLYNSGEVPLISRKFEEKSSWPVKMTECAKLEHSATGDIIAIHIPHLWLK